MKVLIVDDDKLICVSLKAILEADKEINVVGICNNGKNAIEFYQNSKPDILLMDIRMNTMTRLEAAEEILKTDKNAKIQFSQLLQTMNTL